MLVCVLPIDTMIITQIFTMARWQIVVKTSEATKQTKTEMTAYVISLHAYIYTRGTSVHSLIANMVLNVQINYKAY